MKKHTIEFDTDDSRTFSDIFGLVELDESTEPEQKLFKILDDLADTNKDYKITVIVEEVK